MTAAARGLAATVPGVVTRGDGTAPSALTEGTAASSTTWRNSMEPSITSRQPMARPIGDVQSS